MSLLPIIIGFLLLSLSSDRIADWFKKIGLPGITGMLFTGIFVGPYVLDFLTHEYLEKLHFLNEIALSYIAFYAGTELYLKEIRDRIKKIAIDTFFLIVAIFIIGFLAVFLLKNYIPFIDNTNTLAVALLIATIFMARSPSSALAIMKEMRAKGPFVKSTIGVTVILDFLVIVIFAVTFAISLSVTKGDSISILFFADLFFEIGLAFVFGYLLSKIISLIFSFNISIKIKSISLLILGYLTYVLVHIISAKSGIYLPFELHVEALLICIIAGFIITNYTRYRAEFHEALQSISSYIYIVFFTLTGAHLAIDYFMQVWGIALMLFFVRLIAIIIGTSISSIVNKESLKYTTTSWTGFITQAGVGIGLATVVADAFPSWGNEFYTLILSVIVLNEIVGPALFKLGIKRMGEAHLKHKPLVENTRDALIFGMEPQSVALARQVQAHGWEAKIITRRDEDKLEDLEGVEFETIENHTIENLEKIKCSNYESIVLMLSDEENLKLAELIYEKLGTKCVIARIKDRTYVEEFKALGVIVVEPYTSMVSLMDNLVRSPNATSILLGVEESQETLDIEIRDKKIHGMQLKFLRLPGDVLILSIKRKGQTMVTHGYSRLRLGDIVTVIGSHESLEEMVLQFNEE